MRFRGGGVGHTSTRNATNNFLADRHHADSEFQHDIEPELEETQNMAERLEFSSSEDSDSDNDGEELADVDDEVEDYGYDRSNDSSDDSDDGRRPQDDGSDVEEDEIEQLGFARF